MKLFESGSTIVITQFGRKWQFFKIKIDDFKIDSTYSKTKCDYKKNRIAAIIKV